MKANKKVMDSVVVAGLAVALGITAVMSNGTEAADRNRTVAEEQLDQNGIAGVATVLNGYESEAADYFDFAISVEKQDIEMVASAGTEDTEESVSEEEKEWQDKLMAKVDDFLYVRAEADGDSDIVGKMYKGDRALIKKEGSTWTKIASGSVKGYVKNEFCVMGTDALKYAKKHCKTVANVQIDGLRIRKSPSTDAEVIKAVTTGEKLIVDTKADEKEGWVAVKVDSQTCYVSEEYVEIGLKTGKAVTIEEEKAAEEAKKAAEQKEKEKASASSNGQKAPSSDSQGTSLAASADEETLLAALVQCEAGGEGVQCMTAVGAVVVNRVHSGSYPNSIYGVIYQRGQFGPASSGRLESRLASGVSSSARQAARAALSGSDPTGGAKSFKLASSGHAGTVIGALVFY